MTRSFTVPALAIALAVMASGCTKEQTPVAREGEIVLGVEGLQQPKAAGTRAALDEWENTEVSVAYRFASTQAYFDKSLTVPVEDPGPVEDENDGQHIETGMEYPTDNSPVSFRGYYPVAAPNPVGEIVYDISGGDVDVMSSNTVTGSFLTPITDKLVFEHELTRITFKLRCAQNRSYPEPVYGVRAEASTATPLMTMMTLSLGSDMAPSFKISGDVFCGDVKGFFVPLFGNDWYVVDMMVQPDVPLEFNIASYSGDREINITSDLGGYWAQLLSTGGRRGEQYTVQLEFSGEVILAQQITVTPWTTGVDLDGASGNQWW